MTSSTSFEKIEKAEDAPSNPIKLFEEWLQEAKQSEPNDANAMCLSTCDSKGILSSRIMLLKDVQNEKFVFYTNRESRKGLALAANQHIALNFHWKSLARQIRIEGTANPVSDADSDNYFASRPRGSQIGAWASLQSRPMQHREELTSRIKEFEQKFKDQNVPRPSHWGGYEISPTYIEFWQAGEFRLHNRIIYKKSEQGWQKEIRYP